MQSIFQVSRFSSRGGGVAWHSVGWLMMAALLVLLTGCGGLGQEIEAQSQRTEQRLETLRDALERGQVSNANLLTQYAKLLGQQKPELEPLMQQLAKDATSNGPLFQGMLRRFDTARFQPDAFGSDEERLEELVILASAADPDVFNDALSDPINVIADMSEGKLARINAISKSASLAANNAEDFGPGSQMVGNPNYGQWRTDSSGMSFWEWYGAYALFSNLFGRSIEYDRWNRYRDYSYNRDYGRGQYSSPTQRKAEQQVSERTRKRFGNDQRTASAYAKTRTGSSGVSRASQTNQSRQQAGRISSSFSKKPTTSAQKKSTSSFRNSKSRTTRSVRRGK